MDDDLMDDWADGDGAGWAAARSVRQPLDRTPLDRCKIRKRDQDHSHLTDEISSDRPDTESDISSAVRETTVIANIGHRA